MVNKSKTKHYAINGLSYKVVQILLSSQTEHKFAKEFLIEKFDQLLFTKFYEQSLFDKDNSFIIPNTIMEFKLPFDSLFMRVFTAKVCDEKNSHIILWSKEDKLSCPSCELSHKGRECFQSGSKHELILPFFRFWKCDFKTSVQDSKKVFLSYSFLDKKTGAILGYHTETIETFPIPLNVIHDNTIEVFLIVPRICLKTLHTYFWQYRLFDRFFPQESFNGRCRICGASDIDMGPNISNGISFSVPGLYKPLKSEELLKKIQKEWIRYGNLFLKYSQMFLCNTCREISFIFKKSIFKQLESIYGKGLCPNCYFPVEWSIKDKKVLNCPYCGASTQLYDKFYRKDYADSKNNTY